MNDYKLKTELSDQHFLCDDSYLNSFLYYKITGRKASWIYKTIDTFVVVCQHPHNNNTLLVFPEVGKADYSLTAMLLQKLSLSQHSIQLARYTDNNFKQLKRKLSTVNLNLVYEIESIDEDSLDWRYPLHIFDTKKISEMFGKDFEKLRTKFRKAEKTISTKILNKNRSDREMRAALKFWEGNMIIADKDTDDMAEFYLEFFKIIENYNGPYEGMLFYEGKRPVGFSVWEKISDDTANSFINLGDTSITGLSDFQTVSVCRHLHEQGVKYLNVGGSETESLDAFKRKFMPCKSIHLHSARVSYHDFAMTNVSFSKFV